MGVDCGKMEYNMCWEIDRFPIFFSYYEWFLCFACSLRYITNYWLPVVLSILFFYSRLFFEKKYRITLNIVGFHWENTFFISLWKMIFYVSLTSYIVYSLYSLRNCNLSSRVIRVWGFYLSVWYFCRWTLHVIF